MGQQASSSRPQQIRVPPKVHQKSPGNNPPTSIQHEGILKFRQIPFRNCIEISINPPLFLESADTTLAELLSGRYNTTKLFTEEDILKLAESVLYTLSYLQTQKVAYHNLCLENIFYDVQSGSFKLLPIELIKDSAYDLAKQGKKFVYLSPELVLALRYGQSVIENDVMDKSNVFVLGMILLEVCSLKSSDDCYDHRNYDILDQVITERLEQLRQFYPEMLVRLITDMLQYDYVERADPKKLSIDLNRELGGSRMRPIQVQQKPPTPTIQQQQQQQYVQAQNMQYSPHKQYQGVQYETHNNYKMPPYQPSPQQYNQNLVTSLVSSNIQIKPQPQGPNLTKSQIRQFQQNNPYSMQQQQQPPPLQISKPNHSNSSSHYTQQRLSPSRIKLQKNYSQPPPNYNYQQNYYPPPSSQHSPPTFYYAAQSPYNQYSQQSQTPRYNCQYQEESQSSDFNQHIITHAPPPPPPPLPQAPAQYRNDPYKQPPPPPHYGYLRSNYGQNKMAEDDIYRSPIQESRNQKLVPKGNIATPQKNTQYALRQLPNPQPQNYQRAPVPVNRHSPGGYSVLKQNNQLPQKSPSKLRRNQYISPIEEDQIADHSISRLKQQIQKSRKLILEFQRAEGLAEAHDHLSKNKKIQPV